MELSKELYGAVEVLKWMPKVVEVWSVECARGSPTETQTRSQFEKNKFETPLAPWVSRKIASQSRFGRHC